MCDADDVHLAAEATAHGTLMLGHATRRASSRCASSVATKPTRSSCRSSWRSLAYKDGGPTLHLTRLEDVEAQAYTLLLAERADVPVPPVVVAGTAGPGAALLVIRPLDGTPPVATSIRRTSPTRCSPTSGSRSALHAARVAHGRLNAHHVVVDGTDGSAIDRLRARDRCRGAGTARPPTSPSCS